MGFGWVPHSNHYSLPELICSYCSIKTLICIAEMLRSIQSTRCLHSGQDLKYSRETCKALSNCISCVGFITRPKFSFTKSLPDYNLWRIHAGLPEVYDTHYRQATSFQYPLRPGKWRRNGWWYIYLFQPIEFIESTWYLYRVRLYG